MMKGQKGITLVALVITIIVMLILAGVSITIVINGGLFQRAGEAVQANKRGAANEAIQIAAGEVQAKYYANQVNGTVNDADALATSFATSITNAKINQITAAASTNTVTVTDTMGTSEATDDATRTITINVPFSGTTSLVGIADWVEPTT